MVSSSDSNLLLFSVTTSPATTSNATDIPSSSLMKMYGLAVTNPSSVRWRSTIEDSRPSMIGVAKSFANRASPWSVCETRMAFDRRARRLSSLLMLAACGVRSVGDRCPDSVGELQPDLRGTAGALSFECVEADGERVAVLAPHFDDELVDAVDVGGE